jgi:hypothetical protein
MADLVSGSFPEFNPLQALTGGFANATQSNIPAYTNAMWFGMTYTDSAAGMVTAKANGVAVPVDVGVVISKVTVLVGAAAGTITHLNVQLFSGIATPAAIGTQTTDQTSTPFTANTFYTWTLPSGGVTITPAMAPQRFVYVSFGLTASVAPSVASSATPVAIVTSGAAGFNTSAPVLSASYTGGGAAQPATLASASAVAQAPLVWLT